MSDTFRDGSRPRLRLLEVAALPFPSLQGTQAFLREECEALHGRGHDVHLLTYAHGDGAYGGPVQIHRVSDWPRERSLRSGPSLGKVVLDVRLARAVVRLDRELRPDLVHAHNYEALAACLAARPRAPLVYHAHTLFGPELPSFAKNDLGRTLGRAAGALADRFLPPRSAMTITVSPLLLSELARLGHPRSRLRFVAPGIDLPSAPPEGEEERKRLGLETAEVICYCGNLDRYQGIDLLLDTVARLSYTRPALRLLVVTASSAEPLLASARERGLAEQVVVVAHPSFPRALELIAAADVCLLPRTVAGGFPIKLLAYLAAGRPVVTTVAGAAGLDLGDGAVVVEDLDAAGLVHAVERLLDAPDDARRVGAAGRQLVERRFSWNQAAAELEEVLCEVAGTAPYGAPTV